MFHRESYAIRAPVVEDQGVEDGGGEVGGEVGKTIRLLPDQCPVHKM